MAKVLVFIKNKISFLVAVMLAAVVGGATTAAVMAAIPNSQTGEVNTCYRTQGGLLNQQGALRTIDAEAGQSCAGNETPLNWEQSFGSKHYKQLKFTIQPGGSDTKPFTFPADTPIVSWASSTTFTALCPNGTTQTLGPETAQFRFVKDSATGRLTLSNPVINFGGSGACAGSVLGTVSVDTTNNTVTVSHDAAGSLAQLTSPVSATWTFWY